MPSPNLRVIVKLPWNRPDQPLSDPPPVEWSTEKADILWKVIAKSRASDSGGTDWKGLAEHLQVPLPYLIYRAQIRYEEDIRGLQEIREALSPTTQTTRQSEELVSPETPTSATSRAQGRITGSTVRLSNSGTPLGVRARLSSLGNNSPRPKKASSSSTIRLQGATGQTRTYAPLMRTVSPSSSEDETDSEDEAAAKEEEADRKLEEQDALDRKLEDLQKMMTNDTLGLVSTSRSKGNGKEVDGGRMGRTPPSRRVAQRGEPSSRSTSQSVSSASSPHGSVPSIPSPPPGSQPHSPINRHLPSSKSSSPPAVSPRSAHGLRYGPLVGRTVSEQGSNHGSEASSFSDISDTSLSASALESALLSNIRGTGSRFSAFARSRFGGRRGGVHL